MEYILDISKNALLEHSRIGFEKSEQEVSEQDLETYANNQRKNAIAILNQAVQVDLSKQRFGFTFKYMVTLEDGTLLDQFDSLMTGFYSKKGQIHLLLAGGGVLKVVSED